MGSCMITQEPSIWLIQWVLHLQEFFFMVECRKGNFNTVPDARAPVIDQQQPLATYTAVLQSKKGRVQVMDPDIWKAEQEDADICTLYEQIIKKGENATTKFTLLADKVLWCNYLTKPCTRCTSLLHSY